MEGTRTAPRQSPENTGTHHVRDYGRSLLASVLLGVCPLTFAAAVADCQRSCAGHLRSARCLASRTKLAVAQALRLLWGLIILSHPALHSSAALSPVSRVGFRWRKGVYPCVGGVEVLEDVAKGRVLKLEGSPGSWIGRAH